MGEEQAEREGREPVGRQGGPDGDREARGGAQRDEVPQGGAASDAEDPGEHQQAPERAHRDRVLVGQKPRRDQPHEVGQHHHEPARCRAGREGVGPTRVHAVEGTDEDDRGRPVEEEEAHRIGKPGAPKSSPTR